VNVLEDASSGDDTTIAWIETRFGLADHLREQIFARSHSVHRLRVMTSLDPGCKSLSSAT